MFVSTSAMTHRVVYSLQEKTVCYLNIHQIYRDEMLCTLSASRQERPTYINSQKRIKLAPTGILYIRTNMIQENWLTCISWDSVRCVYRAGLTGEGGDTGTVFTAAITGFRFRTYGRLQGWFGQGLVQ